MILDIVNNLLLHVEVKKKVSTRGRSRISGKEVFVCSDLILYVPSTVFQLNRDRTSWVESVLS